MLPLLCLVLSCWALGASVPVTPATGPACIASSLLKETINNIEKLQVTSVLLAFRRKAGFLFWWRIC